MPAEYRAVWTVPGGGTGYSVFHFQNATSSIAQDQADGIHDFFDAVKSQLPDDVQVNFEAEVLSLAENGTLLDVFPVTPPAEVDGSSSGVYQRPAGVRIDWLTGQIVSGRRLNGRTYIVPVVSTAFDTEGLLVAANRAIFQGAADTLISDSNSWGNLAVWSRTHTVTHDVITASIPAASAILRGRRD